jgi:hypothetical protein
MQKVLRLNEYHHGLAWNERHPGDLAKGYRMPHAPKGIRRTDGPSSPPRVLGSFLLAYSAIPGQSVAICPQAFSTSLV